MELTPRTLDQPEAGTGDVAEPEAGSPTPSRPPQPRVVRRRVLTGVAVVVVLVGLGVVVFKGLSDATVYFLNADEAVEQRDSLGSKRFRLQGTVQEGVTEAPEGVAFEVSYNGVTADVRHAGDPPQMFEPGIPVVLEGRWADAGGYFSSDTMYVRHDAEYESEDEYEKRMAEVEGGPDDSGGQAP